MFQRALKQFIPDWYAYKVHFSQMIDSQLRDDKIESVVFRMVKHAWSRTLTSKKKSGEKAGALITKIKLLFASPFKAIYGPPLMSYATFVFAG